MKKLLTITATFIALSLISCTQEENLVLKEGQIEGMLIEEYSEKDQRTMPRRRVKGAGVSVRTLAGSSRTLNPVVSNKSEEVSFDITDENGDFSLDGIPAGNYVVVFEYESMPTDPSSNNQINISDSEDQKITVDGLIQNGVIFIDSAVE